LEATCEIKWSSYALFQTIHRGPGGVLWRSILLQCPHMMTTYCSGVRQQTLLEDNIATE